MSLDRRSFLRGAGGVVVGVPFLELFAGRAARAQAWEPIAGGPTRLLVFHHGQGTILRQWRPSVGAGGLSLPAILEPISDAGLTAKCLFIAGVDNKCMSGHGGSDRSLLTCDLWGTPPGVASQYDPGHANGPSVEEVIASTISGGTPHRRVDVAVGGGQWGQRRPVGRYFYHGANDPVSSMAHPQDVFDQLFSAADPSASQELARLRFHRLSVLDAVSENLRRLRGRLGIADRARLDAHAQKIREIELRLAAEPVSCGTVPSLALPADYDYRFDDHVTAPLMGDLLAAALACGQTRVATMYFADTHGPSFDWLYGGEGPTAYPGSFENWHDLVHNGRAAQHGFDHPDLVHGYRWYTEQFAHLCRALDQYDDGGRTVLDDTLVLWTTEFGDGGAHEAGNLPVVVAGNNGGGTLGRFVDHAQGSSAWTGDMFQSYPDPERPAMHNVCVSVLNAFGLATQTFGRQHVEYEGRTWDIAPGGLDGFRS